MAALITLCNQALAEIAKDQIADLTENSLESRECSRFAQPLLAEMMDWSDQLPLGRTRVVLASIPNERPAEWLYAYAAPADIGSPIAILPIELAASSLPLTGPYTFPAQDDYDIAFLYEGGTIYTNAAGATLVYSKTTIDAGELSPLMQRAFVLELAARLAGPLTKDRTTVDAKSRQAELARQRAIADEENKNPRKEGRYVSSAEYARAGYL